MGIIANAQQTDDAYEAHRQLLDNFARTGLMREAARVASAMLALRPNDPDILEEGPVYDAFGRYPDMMILNRQSVSFSPEQTNSTLNIPCQLNANAARFYLDTGANFSVMSDAEADALGLNVIDVKTKAQDLYGSNISLQIVDVDQLMVGPILLRHVPFLVIPAENPPFNGLPLENQGLFGIQVALALETITLQKDGRLDLASPSVENSKAASLTFEGMVPVLHVSFQGKLLPFTFDTGGTKTILNPAFAQSFPDLVGAGITKDHQLTGMGGTVIRQSIELPTWSVTLGSKTASVENVSVLTEKSGSASEWAFGNMGIDVLQQFTPFTIDFLRMKLWTSP